MPPDSPKLLVVSNPGESAEIAALLAEEGFSEPLCGSGGDDTLMLFERAAPDLVVLAASLDRGDARSLAAAVRSGRHGRAAPILLVGGGSIRTAGDAADFEVDSFVGRPLASEALARAVRACLEPAPELGDDDAPSVELTQQRIAEATDRAIDSFVIDAMHLLDDVATADTPAMGTAAAGTPTGDDWGAPPEAPREPTFILTGSPKADTADAGAAGERWVSSPRPELGDLDGDLADTVEPVDDDLPGDLSRDLDTPAPGDLPPSGGAFARELRRKMSAMAERLFPGEAAPADLDVRPPHDAHTEIDLAALPATALGLPEDVVDPGSSTGGFSDGLTGAASIVETDTREQTTSQRRPDGTPHRGRLGRGDGDVATVLARFLADDFSGRVLFRHEGIDKTVHVHEGRPVFVTSTSTPDRMGDLLYREGKITRAQHQECRQLVAETGRRMGEILVEHGFLKPRELLPAVRRHLEDLFYSLFSWQEGEFEAIAGAITDERIRLSRHPAALILEGVRRKYELDRLAEKVGCAGAVVEARPGEALETLVGVADLTADERAAVELFDGERGLVDVAEASGLDLLGVYQLAHGLVVLGVAEILEGGGSEREAPGVTRGPSLIGETDLAIDRQRVRAKHALVEEADYFSLLGVRRDATRFEIRRAYEAARRDYAVDSFPVELGRELERELADIAELLEEAYEILRDDGLRRDYLANLGES